MSLLYLHILNIPRKKSVLRKDPLHRLSSQLKTNYTYFILDTSVAITKLQKITMPNFVPSLECELWNRTEIKQNHSFFVDSLRGASDTTVGAHRIQVIKIFALQPIYFRKSSQIIETKNERHLVSQEVVAITAYRLRFCLRIRQDNFHEKGLPNYLSLTDELTAFYSILNIECLKLLFH